MQLAVLRRRALRGSGSATALAGPRELTARWLAELLPFEPTADQLAAMAAIDADLARTRPMQRLLMGEVGSGKTVVALYALLRAVEHGLQGALMAPTETLAEQHFATLQALVPDALLPSALLTGSTPARRRADVLGKLASGELALVVGTHALIEDDVAFDRLAVAVVDEQHRFGVRQRAALDRKGPGGLRAARPAHDRHADPAHARADRLRRPRRDATARAAARAPADRHARRSRARAARARAYERLREELRAGRQAYRRLPARRGVRAAPGARRHRRVRAAARRRAARLRASGCCTGSCPPREAARDGALHAGEAHVLVATTVIEVGVDVPNATVMLVEDAERFGISQLHQLRGRVGRGEHPSHLPAVRAAAARVGCRRSPRRRRLRARRDRPAAARRGRARRRPPERARRAPRRAAAPGRGAARARARDWAQRLLAADPELAAPEHALLGDALERVYGVEAREPIPA